MDAALRGIFQAIFSGANPESAPAETWSRACANGLHAHGLSERTPPICLASIDIYCHESYYGLIQFPPGARMSSSLNVQLTDELRRYVDERASDKDVYATPSEYIRDLIRQDMQDRAVALNVLEGLDDLKHGRFSDKSILDFRDED
jgi:antitoxin ParD1/3/4